MWLAGWQLLRAQQPNHTLPTDAPPAVLRIPLSAACRVCACMQTQAKVQLDERDGNPAIVMAPYAAPAPQAMHPGHQGSGGGYPPHNQPPAVRLSWPGQRWAVLGRSGVPGRQLLNGRTRGSSIDSSTCISWF